jgi:hypothetical protein
MFILSAGNVAPDNFHRDHLGRSDVGLATRGRSIPTYGSAHPLIWRQGDDPDARTRALGTQAPGREPAGAVMLLPLRYPEKEQFEEIQ